MKNYKLFRIISDEPHKEIEFEDKLLAWIDNDTNLMWELKNKINIEFKYIWSKKYIDKTDNTFYLNDDVKDIFSYVDKLNKMTYAGHNDWRIPTMRELESLIISGKSGDASIKIPLSKNYIYACWSSDSYVDIDDYAWNIDLAFASKAYDLKTSVFSVYCVREGIVQNSMSASSDS